MLVEEERYGERWREREDRRDRKEEWLRNRRGYNIISFEER